MTSETFSYRQEIGRKLIHLSSLWMPFLVYFCAKSTALAALAAALILMLLFEHLRRLPDSPMGRWLTRRAAFAMRTNEIANGRLTGATTMLAAAFLVTLLFPTAIVVAALSITMTADTAAALIGRRYGRTRLLGKSLEGSAAFLLTALATIGCVAWLAGYDARFLYNGLAAACVATFAELYATRLKIDDNITVSLAGASAMWLASLI